MKFLIVDDSDEMREMVRLSLCTDNDFVMECSDGESAVRMYNEFKPDFVLMDIRMKNMNGIEATKKICRKFPDARILIVTDYDTHSFRQAAKKAGATAFFSKENLFKIKKFIANGI